MILEYNIMSGEPAFQIDVSFRNFKFTRGFAVKDTQDALTELITNAVDAYRVLDPNNLLSKYIYITFHRVSNGSGGFDYYLQVSDRATGVDPSKMKQCFLVAGANTSQSELSRGYFATGAKNVSILGDVYYTSIRSSQLSQVYLDDQVYGHIVTYGPYDLNDPTKIPDVVGVPVTNTQREILSISNNGLNATMKFTNSSEIAKFTSINAINDMLTNITKAACLREIFADKNFYIMKDIRTHAPWIDILNTANYKSPVLHTNHALYDGSYSDNFGGLYCERLTYSYPKSSLLQSIEFTVPDYPEYTARFVMFKTDSPIAQPLKENQMEFGFLIKDSNAVHEVNTLDDRYRWNPNINYLYGFVSCDGFNDELKKYDNGLSDQLILDPSRVGGLNHSHTLYKSVMSVCLPRLDKAILDIQNNTAYQTVNVQDLDVIVSKLEDLGVDVFNQNQVSFNYNPDRDGALAMALKQTDQNIMSEVAGNIYVSLDGTDTATVEELKRIGADPNSVYYVDNNNEIQTIPFDGSTLITNPVTYADAIHKIADQLTDISAEHPYVYVYNQGEWKPTSVYLRGTVERTTNTDTSKINVTRKSLSIQFINDINHGERYLIDMTQGITIKINLHNTLVAAKLSRLQLDEDTDEFNLSSQASYDALQFLETLMADAFSDIVFNSDAQRGLIDTSDTANPAMKALDYWVYVSLKVEPAIHALFSQFISQKRTQMQDQVIANVETAKARIMQLFTNPNTTMADVESGATLLGNVLNAAIANIL